MLVVVSLQDRWSGARHSNLIAKIGAIGVLVVFGFVEEPGLTRV